MEMSISYAEMSFIRTLVQKEQMRIWKEDWLPRMKNLKDKSLKEVSDMFNKIMKKEPDPEWESPIGDRAFCHSILTRIQKKEKEIQKKLS